MLAAVIITESATFPLAKQIDHQIPFLIKPYLLIKVLIGITVKYRARYVTMLLAVPATKQRLHKTG